MKKNLKIIVFVLLSLAGINVFSQKVGIGTSTPQFQLHVAGNIKADSLAIGTTLTSSRLILDGQTTIHDDHYIEFGGGLSKDQMSGKIHFNAQNIPFSQTFTRIYGAGTLESNRKIKFFAEGGTAFTGGINVNGKLIAQNIKVKDFLAFNSLTLNLPNSQNPFTIKGPSFTNIFEVNNNGNVGIGINNPPANPSYANLKTFHVNGNVKTDTLFSNVLGAGYNADFPNISGLKGFGNTIKLNGNSTLQIYNIGEENGGKIGYQSFSDALDIVGIGPSSQQRTIEIISDDFKGYGNFNVEKRTLVDMLIGPSLFNTQKINIGYNDVQFTDMRHGTFAVGSGLQDTLVKIVTFTFPQPFSNAQNLKIFATARAENSAQDIFSVTLTEVEESSVKFIIRRMDIEESDLAPGQVGWAQNLQIDWWAVQ